MKKAIPAIRIFLFLQFAFLSAPAWAASPEIELLQETYTFGDVYQGATVHHTFHFRNAGDAPLRIEKVRTSCGCTAALLSEEEVAPGEQGELKVSFDSARFQGPVTKTVYLYSNDPLRSVVQMYIRGRVKPEIVQDPMRLDLGPLAPDQERVFHVKLTNQGKEEISFPAIRVTAPELQAEISSDRLAPGESARVSVSVLPREGKSRINGYLLIETTSANVPELRIPVYGTVSR